MSKSEATTIQKDIENEPWKTLIHIITIIIIIKTKIKAPCNFN